MASKGIETTERATSTSITVNASSETGTASVITVPRAGSVAALTSPLSRATVSRTTSSPTPRPDTCVTLRVVRDTAAQQKADRRLRIERGGVGRRNQPPLDGGAADLLDIDAAPVILAGEHHAVGTSLHVQSHAAGRGLAGRDPLGRGLDSMSDRVAHDVHEGVAQARRTCASRRFSPPLAWKSIVLPSDSAASRADRSSDAKTALAGSSRRSPARSCTRDSSRWAFSLAATRFRRRCRN